VLKALVLTKLTKRTKLFCLSALLLLGGLTRAFGEAVVTYELGHQNYLDTANSRMVQNAYLGVAGSAILKKYFTTGLFFNGVYAVTAPNYILCMPGIEIGGVLPYDSVFQTFTARIAPVFHNTSYITDDIDLALGAKFRNYIKLGSRNLYFVFTFGLDYFTNRGNMAYTITLGLGQKAFFSKETAAAPVETGQVETPATPPSYSALRPQIPRPNSSGAGNTEGRTQ